MKKLSLLFVAFLVTTLAFSAPIDAEKVGTYHRSSLVVMPIIHMQDSFSNELVNAALTMPFPDRYDKIQFMDNPNDFIVKLDNHCNLKQVKDTTAYRIYAEALKQAQIAKYMVAAWFNYNDSTGFNTHYIAEKGNYDASVLAQELAAGTISGAVNIADASDELISKSFVLVNDMAYINHAARAELASDILEGIQAAAVAATQTGAAISSVKTGIGLLDGLTGLVGSAVSLAGTATALAADVTQNVNELLDIEGFAVMECTYLYQLVWDEETQNTFYSKYYTDTADSARVAAFWADNTTFKVKYVGMMPTTTNNATAFHAGQYAHLSQEEQITITCSRTQDDAINNLQSEYEDFRVYTPITEVVTNPKGKAIGVVAPIGMKEGVSLKKKYDLMEQTMVNGRTVYKLVEANLKPDKQIWDNRYVGEENTEATGTQGTVFKTMKPVYPGMLLMESKKKQKSK